MKIREALRYSRIYRIIEKALSYSSVRDFSILFFSKFLQIVFGLIMLHRKSVSFEKMEQSLTGIQEQGQEFGD